MLFIFLSTVFWYFSIRLGLLHGYKDEALCRKIGRQHPEIGDRLLNAYQLLNDQSYHSQDSRELCQAAFISVWQQLKNLNLLKIFSEKKLKDTTKRLVTLIILIIIISLPFRSTFQHAIERLSQPTTPFERPLPFQLFSLTGDISLLSGADTTLQFRINGKTPPNLFLKLQKRGQVELLSVPFNTSNPGKISYRLKNITEDLTYQLSSINAGLFSFWREINSPPHQILIIDRPRIEQINLTITYPPYTGLPRENRVLDITRIKALKGSLLQFEVFSDQPLQKAYFAFSDSSNLNLTVNGKIARGEFQLMQDNSFHIRLLNSKGITNLSQVNYQLQIQPDHYPVMEVITPTDNLDLDQSMQIPLHLRISDDFGFSTLRIAYRKKSGVSPEPEGKQHYQVIPTLNKQLRAQEIYYDWDLGPLTLLPRDEIHFTLQVLDNDQISGPKMTSSKTIIARFPSLLDIFTSTQQENKTLYNETDELVEDMQKVKETLEEIALELKKHPTPDWEQQQTLEQSTSSTRETLEKLEQINDRLQELIEKSSQNDLFSPEVLEKYQQLQETLQEIMTPELREAMEKLRKALESLDENEIKKALSEFQVQQEELVKELERVLELFKRVEIEQKTDFLVKQLEELTSQEAMIREQLQDSDKLQDLAPRQEQIAADTRNLEEIMQETADLMEQFPIMPADSLRQLLEQLQQMQLPQNLRAGASAMRSGEQQKAMELSSLSLSQLQQLLQQMKQFQQFFQQQTLADMSRRFQNILQKVLQLSKRQEALFKKSQQLTRGSSRIEELALQQSELQQALRYLIQDLIELSRETFAVTKDIGVNLGKSSFNMQEAVRSLESREVAKGRSAQQKALTSLNETARSVLAAMRSMQASGSASGFQAYLQQLQQIAQQQQGINQLTLKLGQGNPVDLAGKEALRRLAAEQRKIRQSLQNLQQQMAGNNSKTRELDGIKKQMDEVIKDLEHNQILRRTIQRQQQILNRLLSAQKSIRQRDFSKKRKSKTAEQVPRNYRIILPEDLGEKKNLLMENLTRSLQNGYAHDYEELIKRYFERLSTVSIENSIQSTDGQ